ncbi:MAG: ABC transporter ATP-binding protein [Stellaceae bacterium]
MPRILRFLVGLYPAWGIPVVIGLGLLCYGLEGLGISLFVPLLQTVSGTSAPSLPGMWVFGRVLAPLADMDPVQRTVLLGGFIFACVVAKNLIAYGNSVLHAFLNARITHHLRVAIVQQLLALSHSYIEGKQSGQLMNSLATETWRTASALGALVGFLISACAVLVLSSLLVLISWRITLVVAVCTVAISLMTRLATPKIAALGRKAVAVNTELANRIWRLFGGMKVIRAFGRETHELNHFDHASRQVRDTFFRLDAVSAVTGPLHEVLSVLLLLAIFIYGTVADRASLPVIAAFTMVLFRLQPQARNIGSAWTSLSGSAAAVREVMWLLDPADKTYIRSGPLAICDIADCIALDRVTFTYPGSGRAALQDVTVTIPSRLTTALAGPSGAGKTTLVNLICRFYDADSGAIRMDSEPIQHLDIASWRNAVGIVSQDIYVFGASVRENIAYGCPDAGHERIEEAARLADAHAFIMELPHGYETRIGDGGLNLSGGQRQRIALARAIVRDPQILVLDEATNSLDSLSEHVVHAALEHFRRDRTIVVIAHRLSTIERADRVIVLDRGRVVQQGDPRTLITEPGLFQRMYHAQARPALRA